MSSVSEEPRAARVGSGALRLAARARGLIARLLHGGLGVAVAVLLPRAVSIACQWLLAATAGPAAVATYAITTAHGSVIVSLFAAGLTAVLAKRSRLLLRPRSRALAACALGVLGLVCCAATAAFELVSGGGATAAVASSLFALLTVFGAVSAIIWPVWQLQGLYLPVLLLTLTFAGGLCFGVAALGLPRITALVITLGSAVPVAIMLRPVRLRRAARAALFLARHSIPTSITNFATVAVYILAQREATPILGEARWGLQVQCWAAVPLLSITSQAFASRALAAAAMGSERGEAARNASALAAWLRALPLLFAGGAVLYALYVRPIPFVPFTGRARDALPATFFVSICVPIVSDPLCFLFTPANMRRALAIGSVLMSGLLFAVLLLWPAAFLLRFGVLGASAMVGALRMAFVFTKELRTVAFVSLGLSLLGYAVSLLVA